jgi:hypothetical protein
MKPLEFLGSSRDDLRAMPDDDVLLSRSGHSLALRGLARPLNLRTPHIRAAIQVIAIRLCQEDHASSCMNMQILI